MTDALPGDRLPPVWATVGIATTATLAAVLWPLATYALTLAAFGLVHVLAELRYVDRRFGPRVPWRLGSLLLGLIAAIVGVRLLALAAVLSRPTAAAIELALVAALAACTLPHLRRGGAARTGVGLGLVALLVWGAWRAPLATLVVLAVAHNLTPVGFLAERLRGATRGRVLLLCALVFGAVPALIVTGWPARLLASLLPGRAGGGVLADGTLADHLGAFVPAAWQGSVRALDLFAAAVYLQCLHYAVVILWLPRLSTDAGGPRRTRLRWPPARRFLWVLLAAAGVSLLAFTIHFRDARTLYGLFALVHAWIEVPVLLLALALPGRV